MRAEEGGGSMIVLKSQEEITAIRKSGQIVAEILADLRHLIEPGVRTIDLDAYAEKKTRERGAVPAFKGYRGYPASLCTSVNEEIIHGIPSSRKLREGDIVSLDFGVIFEGYYGDAAVTYPVGEVSLEAIRIMETVEKAFYKGFEKIREGGRISDISHAVQSYVESRGFSVIRSFVGHGIGLSLHEDPQVPNFGPPGRGPKMRIGLVLAIEPMIAAGDWNVEIKQDNWTAVTADKRLSAHFEHTIALTTDGAEILSQAPGKSSARLKESPYA
jgi:methionyl aminopeptidase